MNRLILFTLMAVGIAAGNSAWAADDYELGPDSKAKPGVPQGKVEHFVFDDSEVFPGTSRDCWVYVPARYEGEKGAALMVFQDGHAYVNPEGQMRVPVVFDNLIHAGEMPVTIGLFVNPGHRGGDGPPGDRWGSRNNRSFEYDSLGDAYARFLIEELIPHVTERFDLKLTEDPEQRAIAGMSSGGICAFTAAWERPDFFRKVLSHIGSFVNIRGGHVYPALIRKTERKPLRIFLQDGANDLNNLHGDWPLSNQQMASALRFAGYDMKFIFGDGAHNGKHGGAILPESLRWLWRAPGSEPEPMTEDNLRGDEALSKVLPKERGWELVGEGYQFTDGACADASGAVYFSDLPRGQVFRVTAGGEVELWLDKGLKISGMDFGPDGQLYAATQGEVDGSERKKIVRIDVRSKEVTDIGTEVRPNDLVVSKEGWIYFTDTGAGQVLMVPVTARGLSRPRVAAGGMVKPNGIGLSPDGRFVTVSEYGGVHGWSHAVGEDGALMWGERFMELRTPVEKEESGGDGMTVDEEGRVYITSFAGIQMFDATGRMGGVIANPSEKACVSVTFGGEGGKWLYACAADKVWRRPMLSRGVPWKE